MSHREIEVRSIKRDVLKEETRYFSVGYFTDPLDKTDATWYELLECETGEIAYRRRDQLQKQMCYDGAEDTKLTLEQLRNEALGVCRRIDSLDSMHDTLLGRLATVEQKRGKAKRMLRMLRELIAEYAGEEDKDDARK